MKKYFILLDNAQAGPFSFDELYAKRILPNTYVWTEGLQQWVPAGQLPELKALWGTPPPPPSPPPPPRYQQTSPQFQQSTAGAKKKSGRNSTTTFLIVFLVAVGVAVAILIANQKRHDGSTVFENASYESKVESVEEHERNNPRKFLDASGTFRNTLFGEQFVINGTIKNNATVAAYKDIVISVRFYSTTNTLLDTKRYVVYVHVDPHHSNDFTLRVERPHAATSCGWDAVNATPD